MDRQPMYFVTFRDVDGTNYVSNYSGADCWSADMDSRNKMLFDANMAQEVMSALRASKRYERDPETGFYQVRVWEATQSDYLLWVGPSAQLTDYLCEGNTKEDLVRLLWEEIDHERRVRLEYEAEQFHSDMAEALNEE